MITPRGGARTGAVRRGGDGSAGDAHRLRIPARGQVVLTAYCVCAVVLAWALETASRIDRPLGFFTRDPASALSRDGCSWDCSYAGAVSNLGALGWAATAATCFLAAALLGRVGGVAPRRSPFLWAGVLTSALLVDDLFMVHEFLYFRGVPELALFGALGAATIAYLLAFRRFLLRTDYPLLLVAGGFFLVSLLTDTFTSGRHLLEDGTKLLGIATWTVYFAGTALAAVLAALPRGAPVPAAEDGRPLRP